VTKVIRGFGWVLIVSGAIVLLYVVYLLWFTGLETERAQRDLEQVWTDTITVPEGPGPVDAPVGPVEVGEAYAALWFERDGERIVNDNILYVLEGVSLEVLKSGPGHYPESDLPGGAGNFAIAGHRTTYGQPFWALDELAEGDTIHVVDRNGDEWVYAYVEQRIVHPTDIWVVDADPLETGAPTITLTTCHPRYSAAQRLIAWGELIGDPREPSDADGDEADTDEGDDTELEELPET
jgi:sortase A